MAKKKSLKERIDALVNALGAAEKPSSAQIRNELVALALDVEELEDGQTLAQKDARILDLEAALEKSAVELGNLKVLLEEAAGELEAFRAEQKEQERKERYEIPDIQFGILKRLPIEHGGQWLKLSEIAYSVKIPVDEAEIHLSRLRGAGLVTGGYNAHGVNIWHRSIKGSELVLAKRLAGDDGGGRQPHKHADLPKIQQEALLLIARNEEGISETEIVGRLATSTDALTLLNTAGLRSAGFATDGFSDGGFRLGRTLVLTPKGVEYLAERDLL